MLDQLAVFVKAILAGALVAVAISSIYIYRVWTKDTTRKVKLSVMGFSIELGETKTDNVNVVPLTSVKEEQQKQSA